MSLRPVVAASVVALVAVACATQEDAAESDGTWVGTITTEGNVTTVVNESGSVWGGPATLVEEASIGVETGADEYMFGAIQSIHADAERIYIIDAQVPAVRMYDHDGNFVGNLGGSGQGPGEYRAPGLVTSDGAGTAFVLAARRDRIIVYDTATGEVIEEWEFDDERCCAWPMSAVSSDTVWAPVQRWVPGDVRERVFGVQAVGPSGRFGDAIWVPDIEHDAATYTLSDSDYPLQARFSPAVVWNPTLAGGLVAGATDAYRFEVHRPDGSMLVVERFWEPIPVSPEQREYERRYTIAFQRRGNDPEFVWDGAEIPHQKPAYSWLKPAVSGEIWVSRYGASERTADCAEDPVEAGWDAVSGRRCWSDLSHTDVFGADGRYLGEVLLPKDAYMPAVIDGRLVVAQTHDETGTYRVKRYRLVLPGER